MVRKDLSPVHTECVAWRSVASRQTRVSAPENQTNLNSTRRDATRRCERGLTHRNAFNFNTPSSRYYHVTRLIVALTNICAQSDSDSESKEHSMQLELAPADIFILGHSARETAVLTFAML